MRESITVPGITPDIGLQYAFNNFEKEVQDKQLRNLAELMYVIGRYADRGGYGLAKAPIYIDETTKVYSREIDGHPSGTVVLERNIGRDVLVSTGLVSETTVLDTVNYKIQRKSVYRNSKDGKEITKEFEFILPTMSDHPIICFQTLGIATREIEDPKVSINAAESILSSFLDKTDKLGNGTEDDNLESYYVRAKDVVSEVYKRFYTQSQSVTFDLSNDYEFSFDVISSDENAPNQIIDIAISLFNTHEEVSKNSSEVDYLELIYRTGSTDPSVVIKFTSSTLNEVERSGELAATTTVKSTEIRLPMMENEPVCIKTTTECFNQDSKRVGTPIVTKSFNARAINMALEHALDIIESHCELALAEDDEEDGTDSLED